MSFKGSQGFFFHKNDRGSSDRPDIDILKAKIKEHSCLNKAQIKINEDHSDKYLSAYKLIKMTVEEIDDLKDLLKTVFVSWVIPMTRMKVRRERKGSPLGRVL